MILLFALTACLRSNASDARGPRDLPEGPAETEDTDRPDDTDLPEDTDVADTDPPEPAAAEVCYLAPSRDYTACLPTWVYDPAVMGADYDYPDPYGGSPQYAAPERYVDLDLADPALDVAPNFALDEFMAAYKGRWGVLQTHLVDTLQEMRDDLAEPMTVNSGYRSPAWNASVGGVSSSRHQYGDAVDLEVGSLTVEELGDVCDAYAADYVGLYEDGHTHCDWRETPLDPAFWGEDRSRPIAGPRPSARLERVGGAFSAPAEGFDEGEPFRRWTAWDARGRAIDTATGRLYTPPSGAVRVTVVVGGSEALESAVE